MQFSVLWIGQKPGFWARPCRQKHLFGWQLAVLSLREFKVFIISGDFESKEHGLFSMRPEFDKSLTKHHGLSPNSKLRQKLWSVRSSIGYFDILKTREDNFQFLIGVTDSNKELSCGHTNLDWEKYIYPFGHAAGLCAILSALNGIFFSKRFCKMVYWRIEFSND